MPIHNDMELGFQQLVLREKKLIWHICESYSLSAAWQTDDAFQEVLTELWRNYPRFQGRSSERTWVYRVATSTLLQLKRKQSNRPQPVATHPYEPAMPDDEGYRLLVHLIERLPPIDCQVVHAHLDGFSHKEIAKITGLTVPAVAMRLLRAKRLLRKQYDNEKE